MPDYGRPAEDIEQRLQRSLAIYPALDYGSTLLARGLPSQPPSGGRKLNGGIMRLAGYKGPTVNIRPPKWTDSSFWIRADNYPEAQYIADAVNYHIGRPPFHFSDANFHYPPLRVATQQLLTRESCSDYVKSIAKGAENLKLREAYRELVKELVLKAVKSPEAVLYLSTLRSAAPSEAVVGAAEENEAPDGAGNEDDVPEEAVAEEVVHNNAGAESAEQDFPMEVDDISEWAIQTALVPYPSGLVSEAPSGGYISTFRLVPRLDFPCFDSEIILQNDWQSVDVDWSLPDRSVEEQCTFFGDLQVLINTLDRDEVEHWMSTGDLDWMPWRPQPNA